MLYSIDTRGWDKNKSWCVPTAISFLTGIPLIHSHSRAAFLQEKSLTGVSGLYDSEAILLLKEQGYRSRRIVLQNQYSAAPRLKKFLKDRSAYEKCMPMMISIEDTKNFSHMIVSHYDYLADNWTMKPVTIDKFPHANKYVTSAFIIEKEIK